MEFTLVNCNGCGAALDVGPDTRFATCSQCGARLAVKRSETAAYTEVLENLERKTDAIAEQLADIQRQNELERIDREWERERETLMISGKNGSRSEPNATMGIIVAVVMSLSGLFWTATTMSMGAPGGFTCFGGLFVIAAIGIGVLTVKKAQAYESAQARYWQRRRAAMDDPPPPE